MAKNKAFYRNAGLPRGNLSPDDFYRFRRVAAGIAGQSVIDVGCGKADFLKIAAVKHRIAGIDMNQERVDWCNRELGQNAVMLGNLDGRLDIPDNGYDTAVCMEVLEHLEDPKGAIAELYRIAAKRVIVTVPYNEIIKQVLCIHCARYTPMWGHLHSFNEQTLSGLVPSGALIVRMEPLAHKKLFALHRKLPSLSRSLEAMAIIDRSLSRRYPGARWLLAVIDKS
ncbi:MAG: class I SAM-dependent methyltransferase [Sphaerochaeta sp.]|jgi:ubiquinone/menaquinone biosynthesis C-methylase UbiE|nr:class I SAM-dependent methyltransferase [Sphaerochaeta sp.]